MDNFDLRKYLGDNKLLKENIDIYNDNVISYYAEKLVDMVTPGDEEGVQGLLDYLQDNPEEMPKGWDVDFIDEYYDDILDQTYAFDMESARKKIDYNLGGGQERHGIEEVNEDPNQKKYSWEEVKHELELNALMAARLIAHQAKGGDGVWEDLVADLMTMARRSKIPTQFDFLEDWYKSQKNNELPNSSSGSFFTGLTDIDGLLSAMNFEEELEFDGESDEDLYLYTDEEYDKAVAYHNAMIRQEVPDWNKY
jgi:hypothetical protein